MLLMPADRAACIQDGVDDTKVPTTKNNVLHTVRHRRGMRVRAAAVGKTRRENIAESVIGLFLASDSEKSALPHPTGGQAAYVSLLQTA